MTDYAALCRDLREVVRLREEDTVAGNTAMMTNKEAHWRKAVAAGQRYENAIKALADTHAPALLALAEGAEKAEAEARDAIWPDNCREVLRAKGKPHPRSGCEFCGSYAKGRCVVPRHVIDALTGPKVTK